MTPIARKAGPNQIAAAHAILQAIGRPSKLHRLDAQSRRPLEVATQDDCVALIKRVEAELPRPTWS